MFTASHLEKAIYLYLEIFYWYLFLKASSKRKNFMVVITRNKLVFFHGTVTGLKLQKPKIRGGSMGHIIH